MDEFKQKKNGSTKQNFVFRLNMNKGYYNFYWGANFLKIMDNCNFFQLKAVFLTTNNNECYCTFNFVLGLYKTNFRDS